ncbi:hypothetical protein [Marinobacter qingdaonensis]|uniref:Uncharacterized protein n=1 Tax=Marinobacter qingdaonensis TaxID=3108486 RepID=A0ABU5NUN1_9GAMM|nr:hypothetical protein [Marinobacter sp. ASW11-75]MEA1079515.1 hypothetical protein [Marinobacter sp. ASW11-75]
MSERLYYHNLDGVGVAQLKGMRLHNVADQAGQDQIVSTGNNGSPLSSQNAGLGIYRTDLRRVAYWSGSEFIFQEIEIDGDIRFKGQLDASLAIDDPAQPQAVDNISGYQYVVTVAGTLNAGATGVAFSPFADVTPGDQILFVSSTEAYVIQRNDVQATESIMGNIRLATQGEVDDGQSSNTAVTPKTLGVRLTSHPKMFVTSMDLTGAGNDNILQHDLNLVNKDGFVLSASHNGRTIDVEVESIDVNRVKLSSLLSLGGVVVAISGLVK